jgi:hypothetical protein
MIERKTIKFNSQVRISLLEYATSEMRDMREQARYPIHNELERRGFQTSDAKSIQAVDNTVKEIDDQS